MKSKEDIQKIMNHAPASRAFNVAHTSAANTTAGRAYALVLILSGAACILMTRKIYQALPFILGIGMVGIGATHTICGLWAKEYQSRETKLTANGIVYIALGLVILAHHADADSVISSIWGVLGLMKGSEALNGALFHASRKEPFAALGIQAIIEVALGFLLLVDPSAVEHHVLLLGLELVAVGWQTLRESKQSEQHQTADEKGVIRESF